MKNLIICLVAVLFVFSLSSYAKAPPNKHKGRADAAAVVRQAHPDKETGPFPGWEKLDAGARRAWKGYGKGEIGDDAYAELMVRTNVPVKEKEKKVFETVGFRYRSVVPFQRPGDSKIKGSIVTGRIKFSMLQCLSAVDFVDFIEAAVPLSPKNKKKITGGK